MEHRATIAWKRTSKDFTYMTYNRDHEWRFRSMRVMASAAPDYRGNQDLVNPEEAFVASISSCHMLTFLAVAAKKKLVPDSYTDEALGYLEKNEAGKLAVTRVVLRPEVSWAEGVSVPRDILDGLHHEAHEGCFIANSVHTRITVEPVV